MAVKTTTETLSHAEAKAWVSSRNIQRLPKKGEEVQYIPAGTYNQYDLARTNTGFELTSSELLPRQ